MEELQVIETTSGRQFKPWASREDVQVIKQETVQAVVQTVQDPASITAITSEIASGKQAIAAAINAKGGSAESTESFTELAEAVEEIPNFDQWVRLACVLASNYATDSLSGYEQNVKAGSVTEITDPLGLITEIRAGVFYYWSLLTSIDLPQLSTIPGICRGATSLKKVTYINAREASYQFVSYLPNLQEVIMPNCKKIGSQSLRDCPALLNIVLGQITSIDNLYVNSATKLKNVTIGQDTDINLPFSQWNPTTVIAEGQSAIDELNSNLYNNLLTKLYDHSNDGQTRTLRIGWLANVTAENIAYANAKGWTLTT